MAKKSTRRSQRATRHLRVRRKVKGSPQRPRLAVFRSLNHVYAQIIDDSQGITLAAASSVGSEVSDKEGVKPKTEVSKLVGTLIAEKAKKQGITKVVFDRAGCKYHGRVKALADAARKGGLVF